MVFTDLANDLTFEKGDIIRFYGEWSGKIHHVFIFSPIKIEATGSKLSPDKADQLLAIKNFIRKHDEQASKDEQSPKSE
jgi:hypothetical protein